MEKKILFLILVVSGIFAFTWLTRVEAKDADEKNMEEISSRMDKDSHEPGGDQKVEARLENKFNVSDARIDSLRKQGLGFGEIGITLSLAKQMPGGINNQNINKIMALRQGGEHKEGWGKIAHDLNLKMGSAKRDMDDVRATRHDERAEERAESAKTERNERASGVEERPEHGFEGHESAGFEAHGSAGFHTGGGGMGGGHR